MKKEPFLLDVLFHEFQNPLKETSFLKNFLNNHNLKPTFLFFKKS